jgi:cell fate (sporulation/competence/biofilm development) regulator YmcA (YheA/YmcA/DUF963 family)
MKETIIEKQIGILRSILSEIAENDLNGAENFESFTNKYFYFDNEFGWNILMNAFYVFEDTELAKENFEKFGINGPVKMSDVGEKYLRLYGILNSLYQQCLATINLIKLFKLENPKEQTQELKNSNCIELRNKIASHPSNYIEDFKTKEVNVYEISRHNLEKGEIKLLKNQSDFENYDLNESVNEFNDRIQVILNEILKKFIKTKFDNKGIYFDRFIELEQSRK